MNEKHIQQILEIEKKANTNFEEAVQEAAQLPVQAEREAQIIIEKARAEAEQEARKLVLNAQSDEESEEILLQVKEKIHRTENLAMGNTSRADAYVINRVIGRE